MPQNTDDPGIKQLFRDMKREDARHVPRFERTWNAALRTRRLRRAVRYAPAAAIVLVLGISLFMAVLHRPGAPASSGIAIASWRSPTLALLNPSEYEAPSVFRPPPGWPASIAESWQSPTTPLLALPARQPAAEAGNPDTH